MKTLIDDLRASARDLPESGIVEVKVRAGDRPGLIPLWVGEGDLPTPGFICAAATQSLRDGETFYTWQRGIPELRRALADYHNRHFGGGFADEEFIVTGSGMQAIRLALDALVGPGEEVVYATPAWPNIVAAAQVSAAVPVPVVMEFGPRGWSLDIEALLAACTPRSRAIFLNSPSNPTGWTADLAALRRILDFSRQHGLWIIADEIYARYYFDGTRAPSLMDIMAPDDRIVFVNTFSKNWSMTGWRVGWLRIHPALQQVFENLVQYSTSGVAQFMQRGAVAALDEGDDFVAAQIERARRGRDLVCEALARTGRVGLSPPQGGFYLFFSIDGIEDTRQAAFRIAEEAGVGLAPGTAFGPGGERHFRLCFQRDPDQLEQAANRLAKWIAGL